MINPVLFGLVDGGWRAEVYFRIAQAMPERFQIAPVLPTPRVIPHEPVRRAFLGGLFYKDSVCAWIFIAPALIGFTVFYLVPCIRAVHISLTDWNLLRRPRFVGFQNYVRLWI